MLSSQTEELYQQFLQSKQGRLVISIELLQQQIISRKTVIETLHYITSGDNDDQVTQHQQDLDNLISELQLRIIMLEHLPESDRADEAQWPDKSRRDACRLVANHADGAEDNCLWNPNCHPDLNDWVANMTCFYDYYDIMKDAMKNRELIKRDLDEMSTTLKSFETLPDMVNIEVS